MGFNSIPPRWDEYSEMGKVIPGTRLVPFKTPLRKEICDNLQRSNQSFTTNDLMNKGRAINLSLVIDLTMTTRFYCSEDLYHGGIDYIKFAVAGGGNMPREYEVSKFCNMVADHLYYNPHGLVGVHCTHGLNRTGYFICRYMIDYLGFEGSYAVKLFEICRGHEFDRLNYKTFLSERKPRFIREPQPGDLDIDNIEFPIIKTKLNDEESSEGHSSNNNKRHVEEKYEHNDTSHNAHKKRKRNKFNKKVTEDISPKSTHE